MKYETALSIAAKASKSLQEGEGNMSEEEVICHVLVLDLALSVIAKRHGVALPSRGVSA